MKILRYVPILLALALTSCSDLVVPDLNNPGLDELAENPTRSGVIAATQGLFISAREGMATRAGYVSGLGIIGRESYNFDGADPRFSAELLVGPLDGGSPAFGGAHWTARFRAVRGADLVLLAAAELEDLELPPAEKAGVRGIANTMKALALLLALNTRDTNGIPTAINPDPRGDLEPFRTKDEAFTDIIALLESAATDLAPGAEFPAELGFPPGYDIADKPAGFLAYNRALRARVAVYVGDFTGALATYLPASFLDDVAAFDLGVYYDYGTGSGEVQNLLNDDSDRILANPSIRVEAQMQGGGALDQRVLDKTEIFVPEEPGDPDPIDQASLGITTNLLFSHYPDPTSSLTVIRNEELILLRAEAYIGDNNGAMALADINLVRTTAGLLDPITVGDWALMTPPQQLDELLYNKRYSLLFEGGHRWIDMRRYDRLGDITLDVSTKVPPPVFTMPALFPVPTQECDARVGENVPSC